MSTPDFASAALRHLCDAEHLLDHASYQSRDQAWHLAGFAHECARKALLREGWVPRQLGHDFNAAVEVVVEVAVALDPRSSRFPIADWSRRYPAIATWNPEHRYDRTGVVDQPPRRPVSDLVGQARAAVDACLVALFLDGTLAIESLR